MLVLMIVAAGFAAGSVDGPVGQNEEAQQSYCTTDKDGYCTDTVVRWPLFFSQPDPVIKINCAVGINTVIELPKDVRQVGKPMLSNKGYLSVPENKDGQEQRNILVAPKRPDNAPKDFKMASLFGITAGTVRIAFEVGVTLLVRVNLADGRTPGHAVERLVLSFPEAEEKKAWAIKQVEAMIRPKLAKIKEREEGLDQEAQALGYRQFVVGRLARNQCRQRDIAAEQGLAIVLVKQFCHIGNRMLADFEIFNRSKKSSFIVRDVEVRANGQTIPSEYALEGDKAMAEIVFSRKETKGTVWWSATDDVDFEIIIKEHGGRGREVRVGNVHF